MLNAVNTDPHFTLLRQQSIATLKLEVQEFEHIATGARHIHLVTDNPENVFLVALRTLPQDSSGVAHILEHTALCGSQRFPVRDPFFHMSRRSLNTFMNAMTSADWTAYPFASINRKDFRNLLEVYLDAVFFSLLDPLDFAQEGHRLEFSEPQNTQSDLVFKGVVYNEMKGAMSSVNSQLWHTLNKYLHPATTYHFNSGGEPDCIPDLTYEQLIDFYKTHYHPSNALFMTYGDIPAHEHQAVFQNLALNRFERLHKTPSVPLEPRYCAPMRVEESYPVGTHNESDNKTHVVLGWLLGESSNLEDLLTAQLVSNALLDHSASPLMRVLETTKLGNAPSPLCGLDDSQREISFVCGLEGCNTDDVDEVETLILNTLSKIAAEGIAASELESTLHQLELHQREIGGDHYPYGMQLILNMLSAATHKGDAIALLDLDAALQKLRLAIADPQFIKDKIRHWLLDNSHRVRLSLIPNTQMAARREEFEKQRLAKIKSKLSEQDIQGILMQTQALTERQNTVFDESILPKVTLEDVPSAEADLTGQVQPLSHNHYPVARYHVGSNGLVYQQIIFDLPECTPEQMQLLPYYTSCLTELGSGSHSYLDMQRKQAGLVGSLSAFANVRTQVDDIHQTKHMLILSGKALNRHHAGLCELMVNYIDQPRFDEFDRMAELIAQMRASRDQSITSQGHSFAINAASAGMCAAAQLAFQQSGFAGVRHLRQLSEQLKDKKYQNTFAEQLAILHKKMQNAPRRYLIIGESEQAHTQQTELAHWFDQPHQHYLNTWDLPHYSAQIKQAWLTQSPVNFCAKAYPTVPMTHPDAPVLVVLGNLLRNEFLHRHVREQGGAYGAGAGQDNAIAAFRFYSYRDPRLTETLNDFDASVNWITQNTPSWKATEEAILGVISSLDKPDSPAGRAKRVYQAELHGRTQALRQQFRERVLAVREMDLQRVARTYFKPELASVAVLSDTTKQSELHDLGFEIQTI